MCSQTHQTSMQAQSVRTDGQLDRSGAPPGLVPDLRPGLLNELCEQVLGAYSAAPHGGIEIGMVLFGKRIGQTIRVQDWRPLPCSHLLGPRFILAPADEGLIPEVLSSPEREGALSGTEPVGWCCSHTRSELGLLDREVGFHERYFRKPGDLAVILKPRSLLRAEGAIFARNGDGRMESGKPLLTVQLPIAEPVAPVGSSGTIAKASLQIVPPQTLPPRPAFVTVVPDRHGWDLGILACLLAILTILVYALVREYPRPVPNPPNLSVALKPTAAGLALVWKSNLPAGSSAQARIEDAAGARNLDLSGSFEPSGVLIFPHRPGSVQAALTVQSAGRTFTGQAEYIDRAPSEPVPPPVPVVSPKKPAKPATPVVRHKRHRRRG